MSKFLKTSVGTEFQAWGLIWAISFSSFPWCSKNFKPLATKPVGFAADGIAKLLMKDWIPPFCHPWILTALPSSALSSWILWIFLLNSSGVLLGSIALVFLFCFFFHHRTEKYDYSPAGRKLCKIVAQSHGVLQAQKGGTVLPRTPKAAGYRDAKSFPPPGLPPL